MAKRKITRQKVTAATHYGDFKGAVSIDEADGQHLLRRLTQKAHVPKGYCPVGFSVYAGRVGNFALPLLLTVYAVDAEVAVTGDELIEYARSNDDVPVFPFKVEIEPADLAELILPGIKELNLWAATRQLAGKPMRLLQDS